MRTKMPISGFWVLCFIHVFARYISCDQVEETLLHEIRIVKSVNKKLIKEMMDLKDKLEHLQKRVESQEKKISIFDKTCTSSSKERTKLKNNYNFDNKKTMQTKAILGNMSTEMFLMKTQSKNHDNERIRREILHPEKRIIPAPDTTSKLAFYAYMSAPELNPGPHHTIIFDTVITNVGSAYNHHTGIFTVPVDGIYIFSWTLLNEGQGYISTQIVINSSVYGALWTSSQDVNARHMNSYTIVVHCNTNDSVYIRTHSNYTTKRDINSNVYGRSSFSGWKL
ncbi:uncharacterized protein LOC134255577 [Saccostrea cucullata]|uniref:uncharacterized protein LOC134255577 n=1 Tax=Saccostrea cuccullata TaxID=36930 RepID=UPI002ED2DC4E